MPLAKTAQVDKTLRNRFPEPIILHLLLSLLLQRTYETGCNFNDHPLIHYGFLWWFELGAKGVTGCHCTRLETTKFLNLMCVSVVGTVIKTGVQCSDALVSFLRSRKRGWYVCGLGLLCPSYITVVPSSGQRWTQIF